MMTVTMAAQERAGMISPEVGHREQPDLSASIIQHECIIQAVREAPLHTDAFYLLGVQYKSPLCVVIALFF